MRLIDPMLMEFDREASTTRKLLERMPDDRLAWKPHPKSMTRAHRRRKPVRKGVNS